MCERERERGGERERERETDRQTDRDRENVHSHYGAILDRKDCGLKIEL